jgi:hypothetical protein
VAQEGTRPDGGGNIHQNSLRPLKGRNGSPPREGSRTAGTTTVGCGYCEPIVKEQAGLRESGSNGTGLMPPSEKIFLLFPLPVKVTTRGDKEERQGGVITRGDKKQNLHAICKRNDTTHAFAGAMNRDPLGGSSSSREPSEMVKTSSGNRRQMRSTSH